MGKLCPRSVGYEAAPPGLAADLDSTTNRHSDQQQVKATSAPAVKNQEHDCSRNAGGQNEPCPANHA